MLTHEYRLMRALSGDATFIVDLQSYRLTAGMVLVTLPGSIIEIEKMSEDYDMQAFVYRELTQAETFDHSTLLHPNEAMQKRLDDYFSLLHNYVQQVPLQEKVLRMLLLAMFADLKNSEIAAATTPTVAQQQVVEKFVMLVNQFGDKERHVGFYAERLSLSPNRLSAVIKEQTGQTVMQWVNRRTVRQAKVLLRFSDKPIYEIAWDLGFENPAFFAKFFHRETGITAREYRKT